MAFARPDADGFSNWESTDTPQYTTIDESSLNEADYIEANFEFDTDTKEANFSLSGVTDPVTGKFHRLSIWAAKVSGAAADIDYILSGPGVVKSGSITVSSASTTRFDIDLSEAEGNAITDYGTSSLAIQLTVVYPGATSVVRVYMIEFFVPDTFKHIDQSGGGLLNAAEGSGEYLVLDAGGTRRVSGLEVAGALKMDAGGWKVHS